MKTRSPSFRRCHRTSGGAAVAARRLQFLLRRACRPVLGGEQDRGFLADDFFRAPAEDRRRPGQPVRDPSCGIRDEDGVVGGRFHGQAKTFLVEAQGVHLEQAVDHRTEDGRIGAQEGRVVLCEVTGLDIVHLEETVDPALGQEYRRVRPGGHAFARHEIRQAEARLRADVTAYDGLAEHERIGLRAGLLPGDVHLADHFGAPAHPRLDEEAAAVRRELEDLGAPGFHRLGHQAAGFGQNLVQILALKRELAEVGQNLLTPEENLGLAGGRASRALLAVVSPLHITPASEFAGRLLGRVRGAARASRAQDR